MAIYLTSLVLFRIIAILLFGHGGVYAVEILTLTLNHTYSLAVETTASVCVGLLSGESYYTLGGDGQQFPNSASVDKYWLATLYPDEITQDVDVLGFASKCIEEVGKVITYSYESQRDLLPQLVSLAIHFEAIPVAIEDSIAFSTTTDIVFDATKTWDGMTPSQTVNYILDKYASSFVKDKLVKINPGYR